MFISLSQSVCAAYDAFKEVAYGKTMYGVKTVMIRSISLALTIFHDCK